MRSRNGWSVCLAPVLFPAACSGEKKPVAAKPAPKAPEVRTDERQEHGHGSEGDVLCMTIDIGNHQFLGDLDLDPATGSVVLTINDHATGKPYPHAKSEATLNLVLQDGATQLKMPPDPLPEDPDGKTSRYKVADPKLKGLKALKGRVNLTIDGKAYLCDLKKAH